MAPLLYIELILNIKKRFILYYPVLDCIVVTNSEAVKEFKIKSLAHVLNRFSILNE